MSTRSELRLSLACGDYDINRGLVDGLDRIGDRRIARLFQDAKAKEIRYFAATGIFPIMHTVVIREDLVDKHPWLAMNVVQAFRQSTHRAFRHMEDPRPGRPAALRRRLNHL